MMLIALLTMRVFATTAKAMGIALIPPNAFQMMCAIVFLKDVCVRIVRIRLSVSIILERGLFGERALYQ